MTEQFIIGYWVGGIIGILLTNLFHWLFEKMCE